MNCDNTDCEGKSEIYFDCILTEEFDSEACRWCEGCCDRDDDMIETNKLASDDVKPLRPLTDKQDMLLLMDFRQAYWDEWVKYCNGAGFEAELPVED